MPQCGEAVLARRTNYRRVETEGHSCKKNSAVRVWFGTKAWLVLRGSWLREKHNGEGKGVVNLNSTWLGFFAWRNLCIRNFGVKIWD